MEQLPLIALTANASITVDLTNGGTIVQGVKGVILTNLSGFLLTVNYAGGSKPLVGGASDYFSVGSSTISQVQVSVSASQTSSFPNPSIVATVVFSSDPDPVGYPLGGLTNVTAEAVTVNGGSIVVTGGTISLYNSPPLLSSSGSQSTGAGTVTIHGFPGAKAGDLGLIVVGGSTVTSATTPTGWSTASLNTGYGMLYVFYKLLTSSDLTATITFTLGLSSGSINVTQLSVSNVVIGNTSLNLVSMSPGFSSPPYTGGGNTTLNAPKAVGQSVVICIAVVQDVGSGATVSISDAVAQYTDTGLTEMAAYQIQAGVAASNVVQYTEVGGNGGDLAMLLVIPQ